MAENIERETFLKDIKERYCLPCKDAGRDHNGCKCRACWVDDMCGDVIDAPAADVVPVVHGRWEAKGYVCGESEFECSVCHKTEWRTSISRFRWCPFCGARMDGDSDG